MRDFALSRDIDKLDGYPYEGLVRDTSRFGKFPFGRAELFLVVEEAGYDGLTQREPSGKKYVQTIGLLNDAAQAPIELTLVERVSYGDVVWSRGSK